jgi:DNA-binding HxlR family transcriptional regulator
MKTKTRSEVAEPLYAPQYPARQVLQIIADTWTPIVLFCMRGRTRRFNELQRSIRDISKKMLTQTLRKLEQRGLLNRLVHPVVPPHVDYSLTPAGNKFAEAVALLCEWAVQNNRSDLSTNAAGCLVCAGAEKTTSRDSRARQEKIPLRDFSRRGIAYSRKGQG